MMKIMITGGSGTIGQYLNVELSHDHDVLTLFNRNEGNCKEYSFSKVDITEHEKLKSVFMSFAPNLVIHAAAVSSPAQADKLLPEKVENVNVKTTKFLAELCHQTKTRLIYFSTDLVYDGNQSSMLAEDAKLNPLSLYAQTKLEGEKAIRNTFFNYLILRQSLCYGIGLNHSKNHFTEVISKLKEGKKVNLFTDQFRTPLALRESARMISELIKKDVKGEVINFGGSERLSRYELIEIAAEHLGIDEDLLGRNTIEKASAKNKVKDVSLSIAKLKSFGIVPKSVNESMERIARLLED